MIFPLLEMARAHTPVDSKGKPLDKATSSSVAGDHHMICEYTVVAMRALAALMQRPQNRALGAVAEPQVESKKKCCGPKVPALRCVWPHCVLMTGLVVCFV